MWLYELIRFVTRVLFWLLVDFDPQGLDHIPEKGPALIVSNHINLMDPLVPGLAVKRRIVFMAKEELFGTRIGRWMLETLEAIPVPRGQIAARRALQRAGEALQQGRVVCTFPEGTRSRVPGMGRAHDGPALLAMRAGVPVVPVAITGTHLVMPEGRFLPRRGPISIRFGEPIQVPLVTGRLDRRELEELTERIMRRIAALLPPEYRGVYAVKQAALAEAGE